MPIMLTRLINMAGKPFGYNFIPRAFPPEVSLESAKRNEIFDHYFSANSWGSSESKSGLGSERDYASGYLLRLREVLIANDLRKVFDAPCGDLNWISPLLDDPRIDYEGGDISNSLVEHVSALYPRLTVRRFDICEDSFPEADVWHCRDCLFHLPLSDIHAALRNFYRSGIPFALLTTHKVRGSHVNLDVQAGGFRYVDLERPPFKLPPAQMYIRDYRIGFDFPRHVGLWARSAFATFDD